MGDSGRDNRVANMARELDPRFQLTNEAATWLSELAGRMLIRTLKDGLARANERGANDIRVCDLRPFVEDKLQVNVAGFAMDDLVDETGVGSRLVMRTLQGAEPSRRHFRRLVQRNKMLGIESTEIPEEFEKLPDPNAQQSGVNAARNTNLATGDEGTGEGENKKRRKKPQADGATKPKRVKKTESASPTPSATPSNVPTTTAAPILL